MKQARDDMAIIQVKVIVFSKDIGGNDRCEVAAMLRFVHSVLQIDHALGVGITFI